jgi:pimeloyl-ACP methyl ester carboxylesterase
MSIKHIFSKANITGVAVTLAATFGMAAAPAAAMGAPVRCQQVSPIPVTLSASDHTVYHVAGQLCGNGRLTGKTVQLLVHGFTYDHRYWDWPDAPQNSYVRSAARAGYTTLAIDRIGDGASSRPADGSQVTTEASAYVVHQLVQKLHAGSIEHARFSKVVTVGHSFGSASVAYEAATYHDVDGVVLSGYMHDIAPSALGSFTSGIYPASQDPAFANAGLNDTYLTTKPGVRAQFFFNTADADPAVIAKDEQIKQTGTTGELDLDTFAAANTLTPDINVPVFIAVGQDDILFCDESANLSCADSSAVLAREQPHFSAQARLQTYVLPASGHDMNLHRNAPQWFNAANNWVKHSVDCAR